jgi:hypothetical protein
MTRKLLPYEHQLIEALGVSEEEYIQFLYHQKEYKDIKTGTQLDIRNDAGVVALVLTIVGTLLQVAAALLAPKPQIPDQKGQGQTKEQRINPRYGFNGAQELAVYGDAVPLVYTNTIQNAQGGVRLSTALLWSAVLSFGSSQFMRLMMLVGAGAIAQIDPKRTAIGNVLVTSIPGSVMWQYFNSNRYTTYGDLIEGGNDDPTLINAGAYTANFTWKNTSGFSQAYAPSSVNEATITAVIPIGTDMLAIDPSGDRRSAKTFTEFKPLSGSVNTYWPSSSQLGPRETVQVGQEWALVIPAANESAGTDNYAADFAQETRVALSEIVEEGSVFKIGSALFKLVSYSYAGSEADISINRMTAILKCTQAGKLPYFPYEIGHHIGQADSTGASSENFYTKCLSRVSIANYSSITRSHAIELALRLSAYRRISGRASEYGTETNDFGYSDRDNGKKMRTSLFVIKYRFAPTAAWVTFPVVFAFNGSSEQVYFSALRLISPTTQNWEIQVEPVVELKTEYDICAHQGVFLITQTETHTTLSPSGSPITMHAYGVYKPGVFAYPPTGRTDKPTDTHSFGLFSQETYTDTQFSFEQTAEVTVTAVNEIQDIAWESISTSLYDGLSTFALHAFSGRNIQQLRDTSVFVTQGKKCWTVSGTGALSKSTVSSSYAPDIFIDTVLDAVNGIGAYADSDSIQLTKLGEAKTFCVANNLFMDGVIADLANWREFWSQYAPFSLLEFARLNGQDTLIPAVPFNSANGLITNQITVSALFNQGNIIDGTYKEEFTDYINNTRYVNVSVVYRDGSTSSAFPKNSTVNVRLSGAPANAPRERIDMSQFVTRKEQAILVAKYLCNVRFYNQRSVEFSTFPGDSPVSPGDYCFVDVGVNRWEGIYTGRVEAGGFLNAPIASIPNGTYSAMVSLPGSTPATVGSVSVSDNIASALSAYTGALFVLGTTVSTKRVFRVVEVSMDEEGQVTIKAVEHPCAGSGANLTSKIAQFSSGFVVEE